MRQSLTRSRARTARTSKRLDRVRRSPSIYSRTAAQSKPKRNLNTFFVFMVVVFVGAIVYLVLYSPYLKISQVSISDLKYYDKSKIEGVTSSYQNNILNKNILTFSAGNLEKKIGESEGIKSVKVIKKYSSKSIQINLEEKRPVFVWESVGKRYLVDEKGIVTSPFEEKFKDLPNVIDTKNIPVDIKSQVASPTFSKFMDDISRDFNTYSGTKIAKIEVPEITSEIKITTEAGWYALFDTTRTAKGQLINLARIISEVKSKGKKLEYIDLRIDNRIFYK